MDASKKSALHLVQAFAPESGLVLGQVKVDGTRSRRSRLFWRCWIWTGAR